MLQKEPRKEEEKNINTMRGMARCETVLNSLELENIYSAVWGLEHFHPHKNNRNNTTLNDWRGFRIGKRRSRSGGTC
jgi:hypothetical protein